MRNNNVTTTKVLVRAQAMEWYGCEDNIGDPLKGRYKNKGGGDFIVEVEEWVGFDKIAREFNKEYNVDGDYFKYKLIDIEYYREPQVVHLKGVSIG